MLYMIKVSDKFYILFCQMCRREPYLPTPNISNGKALGYVLGHSKYQ